MKEKGFRAALVRQLDAGGALVRVNHGNAYMRRGWPDLDVWHKDVCCSLELKIGKSPVRPEQKRKIEEMRLRHFPAFVVRLMEADELAFSTFVDGDEVECARCAWSRTPELPYGPKMVKLLAAVSARS